MQSRWSATEAEQLRACYAKQAVSADIALLVYCTRRLGREPALVLHGGGNTSVKTWLPDLLGNPTEVLCVKGSGWDMAAIEPAGLPAVRLGVLQALRSRPSVADDDMVRIQRAALLDPAAPNPSVEAALHAFLPHKFVAHTHATAVLSLTDQPDGFALCRAVYGDRFGLVPYVMPGFALARQAAEVYEADPDVHGLILIKHGLFTFGASAQEAYERMIEAASLAEARLLRGRKAMVPVPRLQPAPALADVAAVLRGACSLPERGRAGAYRRFILDFRTSPGILAFVNGADLARYSQAGVVTPDHTIRTKNWPMLVGAPQRDAIGNFKAQARAAAKAYVAAYEAYFARHNQGAAAGARRMLDPLPRVVLVPGVGLFGLGLRKSDAAVVADLAESAIKTIADAEAIGRFESISERDMFNMEYWSLEQAKLGKGSPKPLAGQIAVITGGAGAIGTATAQAFAAAGAEIALLDIDSQRLAAAGETLGAAALAIPCDVTDLGSVQGAFRSVIEHFGGIDIVVSNAGAAAQGRIGEVAPELLRQSFEVNFFAHQFVAQTAVRAMLLQGIGGVLLFNISKQAVNPGRNFGPYGLAKAATLHLVRQYALEYGAEGIRANAVNADRVRSGLLTAEMIAARAAARGVSAREYLSGNLLGREVTAEDVAQAFLYQAQALATTGNVITVDGGNIAAALR